MLHEIARGLCTRYSMRRFGTGRSLTALCLIFVLPLLSCRTATTADVNRNSDPDARLLAEQAERRFASTPRTVASVTQALDLMTEAHKAAGRAAPERFDYLTRAAKYAIWLSYHSSGKPEKSSYASQAMSLANRAITVDKSRVEGFYYRSLASGLFARQNRLVARNAMKQIRRDLTVAQEIDPAFDFGGPHRVLGALYLRAPGPPAGIGSKRKALFHLEQAYKLANDYPENLLFLAEVYLERNRIAQARQILDMLPTSLQKYGDATDRADWQARMALLLTRLNTPK